MRALWTGALVMLLAASAAADRVTLRVPLDDQGRVAASDLSGLLLKQLGSRVTLPPGLGHVKLTGRTGRLALAALNVALAKAGVEAQLEDDALAIEIDRTKLAGRIDAAEDTLREWFDAPARYELLRVPGAPRGPPVVIVHGLDSSPERLMPAAKALAEAGYDAHLLRYPNDGRIERTATQLGRHLRELHRRTGRKITLVTTSMGGVITRTYLELSPDYGSEIERFIACNPPFQGSWMARYHPLWEAGETVRDLAAGRPDASPLHDGLGQASLDLLPDSELMTRLRATERRDGVRYSILAGADPVADEAVILATGALIEHLRPKAGPWGRTALDLAAELVRTAKAVSAPGDGAVPLASQTLDGVTDRVVRPYDHLDALTPAEDGTIAWLPEVLERLPPAP